jgi:serine phosphatase RsbU (regulator of sigma subunit)/pSer/pThr/pTyr-binding forkhead associated (FHA) protein
LEVRLPNRFGSLSGKRVMAVLEVVRGSNPGQQFSLESERAVLGRHPECDIVLDQGAVSRQHAQILQLDRQFFVEDLKSRNGTFVNGELIRGRHPLKDQDRVKICDLLFTFYSGKPEDSNRVTVANSETFVPNESGALLVDDAESPGTTVMSTLDIQQSRAGLQMTVNPEIKLKALLEITRNIGTTISLDEVLPKILDSLFKIFIQADRGFVVLLDAERKALIPKAIKHRRHDADDTIRISRTIVAQVMKSKEAILSADAANDSRFDSSQSVADFRIRSMMCAPLVDSEGRALGVIQIDTLDQRSRFQQDDLDVLASVACQAAIAVENAQLHETALRQQALERDLDLAHKVQQGILPSAPPQVPGYDFFDFYDAASQVGGDFFDYVQLPGSRLAIVLADVSGKGMPAALVVARLSSEARYTLVSEPTPSAALERLNQSFSRSGWEDRFVTLVLAVIDLEKHRVTVANAGHMAPLLRRADGSIKPLGRDETGLPLGVDFEATYRQLQIEMRPGDHIMMYTDGISEAMNDRQELYGIDRLQAVLKRDLPNASVQGARVLDDVRRFVGGHQQTDDMCLLCFGRPA